MRYPLPAKWRIRPEVGGSFRSDGDTFWATVDRGKDDTSKWSIRLKGVRAPEFGELGYAETRAFILGWLAENVDGSDWPYELETFQTPVSDKILMTITRFVGVVRAANGRILNDDVQAFVNANGYPGGY